MERNTFSGSLGFILASAASAVGLGNIWRFPYLAARDGGGVFILMYILLAMTFGFTLLITEVAIGRRSQQGPLTAYRFFHRRWGFLGYLAFLVPFIIYPYYCVIGGWVMKYLTAYLTLDAAAVTQEGYFTSFITSPAQPVVFLLLFAVISYHVVKRGVEHGIERLSRILMPALLLMVIGISAYSLTLSHTDADGITRTGLQGARYLLLPNFEGMTLKRLLMVALDATGQLFYSLSVAMGIMVAYGSYMKRDVNLGRAVDNIEICDTMIAVLAGLMIIPSVYVFTGTEGMSAGPGLMFIALPQIFASMGSIGTYVGLVFFLMVFFSALTSAISILEACVSGMMDRFAWSRRRALRIIALSSVFVSLAVSLGYNVLYFDLTLPNGVHAQLLDVFDYLSNNLLMPFLALLTCVLIGWVVSPRLLVGEIRLNGYKFRRKYIYILMLRFVVPFLLIVLLFGAIGLY